MGKDPEVNFTIESINVVTCDIVFCAGKLSSKLGQVFSELFFGVSVVKVLDSRIQSRTVTGADGVSRIAIG